MHLKNVILRGFKSFADKTALDFGPGVTAIVGPNGCGKSNVCDAVRWVIGEQNPRLLRGHRMHDLIFGGTETRPAESMAEVSLVIDNSDSLLPLPYREIEITRRLFRDGESEYLINRNTCRLKDIAELFMDTGVGTSAYSLMEQGRVDQIVNARPLERRAIFEEAAGITKYKTKRDEAVRRVKRTEADLIRLSDIVQELERQVRSLKRQAGIARRYREIKTELRQIEMTLLHREYGGIQESLRRLSAERQSLAQGIEELEASRAAVVDNRDSLLSEVSLTEARIREAREKGIRIRAGIEKLEVELSSLREREEDLLRQQAQLEEEVQQTEHRAHELSISITETIEREGTIAAELEKVRAERDSVSQRLTEIRTQRQQCEENLRRHRADLLRFQNEVTGRENDHRELEREIFIAERSLERLQAEKEKVLADGEPVEEKLNAGWSGRDTAQQELVSLRDRLKELSAEHNRQESHLDEQNRALLSLDRQIHAAEARLEGLENLQRSYEGYATGTRFLIQKREEDQEYARIHASVAELVTVEPRYERALEVALALELQSLVTDDRAAALALLQDLRREDQGRATFAILNGDYSAETTEAIPQGTIHALDVIHTEDKYLPLMRKLFGGVLLVEDVEAARRCIEAGHDRWRLVTIEGELFEPRGLITGGSASASGILSRAREIEEIRGRLTQLSEERDRKGHEREVTRQDLSRLNSDICKLENDIHEKDIQVATFAQEIAALERERTRLAQHLETVTGELGGLIPRVEELRGLIAATEEDLAKVRAQFDACKERLSEAERNLQETIDGGAVLQEEERELQLRVLEKEKDLERLRDTIESFRREDASLRSAQGERRQRIEELEERRRETITRRDRITADIGRLYSETEEANQTVRGIEDEHRQVAERVSQVKASLEQTEAELSSRKERAEQLEREVFRLGVSAENLERRAKQDHGGSVADCESAAGEESRPTPELEELATQYRERLGRIGTVNELAIEECQEIEERFRFMKKEQEDLEGARRRLLRIIAEINRTTKARFEEAFEQIRGNFQTVFRRTFGGGRADLLLVQPDEESDEDPGVEIVVQPPGKNLQSVTLLSGGEKAMTAITLLFAIYQSKPSPFCILDEIDAPLDDANVMRFCDLVRDFSSKSQFIIITHNKGTMEMSDALYGVTMEDKGVSSLVAIEFDETGKPRAEAFIEQPAAAETPRPARRAPARDGVEAVL